MDNKNGRSNRKCVKATRHLYKTEYIHVHFQALFLPTFVCFIQTCQIETHRESFYALSNLLDFSGAFESEDEGTLRRRIYCSLANHQVLEVQAAVKKEEKC